MIQFRDVNDCLVEYSPKPEFGEPWHTLVICRFQDHWVLTHNNKRGLEFPGGKREKGETIEEAGIREVYEETGGIASNLQFLGQYKVYGVAEPFVKSVYFTHLCELKPKHDYFETNGPVLLAKLPENIKNHSEFSFIMKDEILPQCLIQIQKLELI
ncbi:RNA deprotection pyrophosphohydrolase [Peribacillus deserti]|uniref:Nucleoside triphosphatase YtkD n=1 Tax=Peribacillus deserti TaxID=673318 RepID=A0A2N5M9L2_9BACI|nr:nucleoside triphosphatase YtkD [Peribacillus deserti]PLT31015.1 nucleoside triphosphatase YtkD [Peribacillus deserti]